MQEEILEINGVLNKTQHLLCFLINIRQGFVPEDMHGNLTDSWPQILRTFHRVHRRVEKLSRRRLSSIGFTGQQLQLKTGGFHYAYGRLVEKVGKTPLSNTFVQTQVNPNSPSDVAPGKLSFILRGLAKQVLAVLKWVNSILGSLSKLVGQAEVLKEFKEVLENSLYTKQVVEGR